MGESARGHRTQVGRARAALARIRLRDSIRRRQTLSDITAVLPIIGPALFIVGVVVTCELVGIRILRDAGDSALLMSLVVLGLMTIILVAMGGMVAVASTVMISGLMLVLLPLFLPNIVRTLWRGKQRRHAKTRLHHEGLVPIAWANAHWQASAALTEIANQDPELVVDNAGLRAKNHGPPEDCPKCSAALHVESAGMRRCDHCGFERFDKPRACEQTLEKASKTLEKVRTGQREYQPTRVLWRAFCAADEKYMSHRKWLWRLTIVYFAAAAVSDLGQWLGVKWLMVAPLFIVVLLSLPLVCCVLGTLARWHHVRFRQYRPGKLAYDQALSCGLVTVLAHQGQLSLDNLADHLGLSRSGLEGLLASLHHRGALPIYRDPVHDQLISLHARTADHQDCPGCGATTTVGPRLTLRCDFCGASQLV